MKELPIANADLTRVASSATRATAQSLAAAKKLELTNESFPFSELFCQLCQSAPPESTRNEAGTETDADALPLDEPTEPDEPTAEQAAQSTPLTPGMDTALPQPVWNRAPETVSHPDVQDPPASPAVSLGAHNDDRADYGPLALQTQPSSRTLVKTIESTPTSAAEEAVVESEVESLSGDPSAPDPVPETRIETPAMVQASEDEYVAAATSDQLTKFDPASESEQMEEPIKRDPTPRPATPAKEHISDQQHPFASLPAARGMSATSQSDQSYPDARPVRRRNSERTLTNDARPQVTASIPNDPVASPASQPTMTGSAAPASGTGIGTGTTAEASRPGGTTGYQPAPIGPSPGTRIPEQFLVRVSGQAGAETRQSPIDRVHVVHRVSRALELARQRDGQVLLRLSPPELGSVRLELRVRQGAVIARIETETHEAKQVLLDSLPALRDRLFEQGIRVERFDVDIGQRQDQSSAQGQGQEHQSMPWPSDRVVGRPLSRAAEPEPIHAPPSYASPGSINVVI